MSAQPLFHSDGQVEPSTINPGFTLRDFQLEDRDAIEQAWASGDRAPLCRHSTGLGKSVLAAELAKRHAPDKRALILVDVGSLAIDLYRTCVRHTGHRVGIITGDLKSAWDDAPIVVSTVQSMYAGDSYGERYRLFDPLAFDRLIVDECEGAVAEKYSEVLRYFLEANPDLKLCGLTATPFRTDGRGMGEIFDHARIKSGVLNRDLLWSYLNGWLVKPIQGFVRCSLDFSTLKVRKQEDGEKDYSDNDITQLLLDQDEAQWREFAEGIIQHAKGRTSIVICPNSIEVAKLVAYHLDGAAGQKGVAEAIYGEQGPKADRLIHAFKNGDYQIAVSVNKLYKGFDYDQVRCVYMLRRTKSRRLYEQAAGRGTRPLVEIRQALHDAPDKAARMAIIAASRKPSMVMVDCVGVSDKAKDLVGVIDILGAHLKAATKDRTRELMLKNPADEMDVGDVARAASAELHEEHEKQEREKRRRLEIQGRVEIEESEIFNKASGGKRHHATGKKRGNSTKPQVELLIALGISPDKALASSKRQAGFLITLQKVKGHGPDWMRVRRWEREGGSAE